LPIESDKPTPTETARCFCATRRKAFTLVELLVVIGIIAILIGVLLPVLGNARRSAANVKCLSNLRQLAYAFQMYAGAYKDAFPLGRQDLPEELVGGVLTPQNKRNGTGLTRSIRSC
jgi:prepilin-type N-terminal cleavage/methylation domain-containing protein